MQQIFQANDGKLFDTQADGWIVNTKTTNGSPATLSTEDVIEVVLSDGLTFEVRATQWDISWNINDKYRHIVKYRKVI